MEKTEIKTYAIANARMGVTRGGTGIARHGLEVRVTYDERSQGDRVRVRHRRSEPEAEQSVEETVQAEIERAVALERALTLWSDGARTDARTIAKALETRQAGREGAINETEVEQWGKLVDAESALLREGLVPSEALEAVRRSAVAGEGVDAQALARVLEAEAERMPERKLGPGGLKYASRLRGPMWETEACEVEAWLAGCQGWLDADGAVHVSEGGAPVDASEEIAARAPPGEAARRCIERALAERHLDAPPESETAHLREWTMHAVGLEDEAFAERIVRAERTARAHVHRVLGIELKHPSEACRVLAEQAVDPQAARLGRYLADVRENARAQRARRRAARRETPALARGA